MTLLLLLLLQCCIEKVLHFTMPGIALRFGYNDFFALSYYAKISSSMKTKFNYISISLWYNIFGTKRKIAPLENFRSKVQVCLILFLGLHRNFLGIW